MALAKAAEPAYGIARLIGEGYGKPDGKDETPVDIQYAKIAEWLVMLCTASGAKPIVMLSAAELISICAMAVRTLGRVRSSGLNYSNAKLHRGSGSTCQLTGEKGFKPFRQQLRQN